MPVIKCKMCGGDLNIVDDSTVCECEYCGTKQTIPKVDDEKKLKLFSRAGKLLRACEFDKASGVFESIIADFPEEAEAYWGLILCKYGIEYVDDPATGKKVPTCHRSSFESVEDDSNFEQACENADAVARRVYRDEARQIETLRKRILEVSGKEEPYDVFISYKELDEDGNRTQDSVIAQDIYRALTQERYRVFFSRISLEGKLGVEYEPYIFAALNSAKAMIVVGTDYEYFDAVWVKNEWSRFLKLIASGQQKTVIPVYKDMDPYDMPKELRTLAAQDMGKIGAMQDLLHGVEKLLGKTNEQAPKEQPVIVQSGGPNVTALLDRGFLSLEDSDWNKAIELFDQVLNMDSRNADAYLGLAMAEEKCRDREALYRAYVKPHAVCRNNKHLARARQFGGEGLRIFFQPLDEKGHKQDLIFDLIFALKRINAIKKKEIERFERERRDNEKRLELERLKEEKKLEQEQKETELRLIRDKNQSVRTMITTGLFHTVGLRTDNSVVAVGSNDSGQCNVNSWTDIVAITAGGTHTVGLKKDGTVVAVGENKDGQCEVSNWTDIVAVSTENAHTVGLKRNGTVVAVGWNSCGRCNVSDWTDIVAITAGGSHTVGLKKDGTVVAVGANSAGQCMVSGWTDIVATAAGSHTVGLKKDGTVVAVGRNNYGQCEVSNWTDIVAITAGCAHTVGLKKDGTAVAVGCNGSGRCNVSDWTDMVAVAAGDWHTVGLKADGTVVAVGDTGNGKCDVSGWKLFNSFETIEAERKAAHREKIADYERKRDNCQKELSNLKGLFTGKRRREIEERLAEIEAELKRLQ